EGVLQLGKGVLRVRFGALPVRRLDEREHRLERRRFLRQLLELDPGAGPRVRIALVVALELLEKQAQVVDAAREQADVIERAGELQHAGARNAPVRRLESV